ncbi:hypothetical protein [Herbaspirillum autotrophicum]|uniref:hypothetical protein n=1 Tax=Herbaspirillum autotrophicum TaxID=180195 RepID=UPI00067BA82C|nr:hypothetical protein [Herbaspirillum autotrophicum]
MKVSRFVLLLLTASCLSGIAQARNPAKEDVSVRDPARWYEPADTPDAHFRNLKTEAGAAYAEALAECRALRKEAPKSCKKEAKARMESDLARAHRIRQAAQ